jgi:hypothetical protein
VKRIKEARAPTGKKENRSFEGVPDECPRCHSKVLPAGGWKDILTANTIYADQQPKWALKEASDALRRIRLGGQE